MPIIVKFEIGGVNKVKVSGIFVCMSHFIYQNPSQPLRCGRLPERALL